MSRIKYRKRARLLSVVLEGEKYFLFPDNDPWQNVPILNFNRDNRQVNLNANFRDNRNVNYAVPSFKGLLAKKDAQSASFA